MEGIADPGLVAEPVDLVAFEPEPPGWSVEQPTPGKGVFFDHHIDLREPEGGQLTDWLVERFNERRDMDRHRGMETWRLRIRKLAANAMRAHFFRTCPAVLYSRGSASGWYREKPKWMKHGGLRDAIDPLIAAGLIDGFDGKKMPGGHPVPSWTASYWATEELIRTALDFGVTPTSIIPDVPKEDLVQLYATKPKPRYDKLRGGLVQPRKGKRIWFDPTPETQHWSAKLAAINAFYRQQKIEPAPDALQAWLAECNADPDRAGPRYRMPELIKTNLYRVFNNGDAANPRFNLGGRLFGGWWMYVPKALRRCITINGEQTVELDYSCCQPRMLYHERNLPADGDLYIVPEISAYEIETGREPETYRPYVKWLTQILINGRGRPGAVERPSDLEFPPDIPLKRVIGFIETMHQPIAGAFRTGAGLRLMRKESDIAFEVLTTAMAEGWTVLPVHDSYITTIDQQDRLRSMMIESYARRMKGWEPVFKG
ncbi:MAG: hypothetical protein K2Q09_04275 [Phycisphaerales bacterium]|nr:hypothetical protein [Phycisphaerales bacterium]